MSHIEFETLVAYVHGRLNPQERGRLEEHLAACGRCREERDRLQGMIQVLAPRPRAAGTRVPAGEAPENCCPPADLYDYYRGRLPQPRRQEVESHLDRCAFCYEVVSGFAEESPALAYGGSRPQAKGEPGRLQLVPRWARWRLAGAAAALCLLVVWIWQSSLAPSISYRIVGQPDAHVRSGDTFEVARGQSLRSGDRIRIQVTPEQDLYLQVLLYNASSGEAQILFPAPDVKLDNHLRKGRGYAIPPGGFWPLDERTGTEVIFLLPSHRPLEGLESLPAQMSLAGSSLPDPGRRVQAVGDLLKDRFGEVETFSFAHR
jgi:anti-sigma factor RsiW